MPPDNKIVYLIATMLLASGMISADTNGLDIGVAGFPVIMSTPETGFGGGGGAVLTFRHGTNDTSRPDNISLIGFATEKKQFMLIASPEVYLGGDNWKLNMIVIRRVWPDSFYGIGNDTAADDEEGYELQELMVQPSVMFRVWRSLRVGVHFDRKWTELGDIEPDGLIESGSFLGTDKTDLAGSGPIVEWDTRDRLFFPSHGAWVQLQVRYYDEALGSDTEFESVIVDARRYVTVGANRVLALQAYSKSLSGDIAFNEFATVEAMRGIPQNRFRDRNTLSFRAEYRFPIHKRFSATAFASTGSVFDHWSNWDAADLRFAGGAGLRAELDRKDRINLRLDIGVSEEGVFPYLQVLEAF